MDTHKTLHVYTVILHVANHILIHEVTASDVFSFRLNDTVRAYKEIRLRERREERDAKIKTDNSKLLLIIANLH